MRKRNYSKQFQKQISKLKGKELKNLLNKINEILNSINLNHYKTLCKCNLTKAYKLCEANLLNLRIPLQKFKRVHINNSFIILFFGDDNIVYFYKYEHHDKIYKKN